MADRFPSLEDIDAGDSEIRGEDTTQGSFLERERAALGDDADLFASGNDIAPTVEDVDEDLLRGDTPNAPPAGGQDLDDFESSFPAISNQNEVD